MKLSQRGEQVRAFVLGRGPVPLFAPHWPSVRGRARADAGPLALVAGVVVAVTLLAGGVPPLMRHTADAATRDAVRRAGDQADVRVESRFLDDYALNGGRQRDSHVAQGMDGLQTQAEDALDPGLRATLQSPVTTLSSISLLVTDGSIQRHFQVDYVRNATGGPALTWVSGTAPKGTVEGDKVIPLNGPPWEAQVGVSEATAAALKLGPGDHVPLEDDQRNKYNVLISGVFRPADPADPAWRKVPWSLKPQTGLDGTGTTRLGGLLSDESLPDGRLAFLPEQTRRTVWFSADPGKLTWESAQALATTVATLKASSASSGAYDDSLKWATQLDAVLRGVGDQVTAAQAQASVLLIAVLAAAALVLFLAAELLVRRRRAALTTARQRGDSLPDLAVELVVESAAVAVPAAVVGLVLAYVITGGAAVGWAVPVVLCAILAGPAFGVVAAARATSDRRQPANRSARKWARRTVKIRRAAIDATVVAVAVGAVVALHQRGVGGDALPASAPTAGVVAGALLLLRLMPGTTGLALRRSLRSRRPLAVFGAARAAATASRVLPLLALLTTTALAAFAVTLQSTTAHGLDDGSWRAVGADARFDVGPSELASTTSVAARLAASPGVTGAVAAEVKGSAQIIADNNAVTPALVIVDVAAYQRLLAATPLPGLPGASAMSGSGGKVPALVRSSDGSLLPGMDMRLVRGPGVAPIPLDAVGIAPPVDDMGDVIIVDAATAAKAGLKSAPDTIWVTGPGAARAVGGTGVDGHAFVRTDVLHDRQAAPLTSGLVLLDRSAAVALILLGLLGFALGAAASAPERWETLARLRTLGLRPGDAHRVAGGELLPPVLVAAVLGPLLGVLLVEFCFGPLALRLLTGQSEDPATVVPWWVLALTPVVLLLGLVAVVAAEAVVRRRLRLADVLRVG